MERSGWPAWVLVNAAAAAISTVSGRTQPTLGWWVCGLLGYRAELALILESSRHIMVLNLRAV